MADRYTSKDVRRVYQLLVDCLAELGMDTSHTYLQAQSGLGGGTRYTLGNLPGVGTFHAIGSRDAYDAIAFAYGVLRAVDRHRADS